MVKLKGKILSVKRDSRYKKNIGTISRPTMGGKPVPFEAPFKMRLSVGDTAMYEAPVELVKQIRTTKTLPRYWGSRKVKILRKVRV
jgi:hypothetical protein